MSDENPTPDTPEVEPVAEEVAAPTPPEVDEPDDPQDELFDPEQRRKMVSEAKNLRRRLRETESTRDTLAERVGMYERAEVESAARAEGMHSPEDVWLGLDLDTLRDEDGRVDLGKLEVHLLDVKASRPHYFKSQTWPDAPTGPQGLTALPEPVSPGAALAQSLANARGGRVR